MICEVGEGTVHRLWEPLAVKQRPPNGYAAKFATPFLIASGFVHDGIGLDSFSEQAVHDDRVRGLATKIRYVVDPDNPYPNAFTGHIRAVLNDGRVIEERQPHFRGGAQEPLSRAELEEKFMRNARHGGWDDSRSTAVLHMLQRLFANGLDLTSLQA